MECDRVQRSVHAVTNLRKGLHPVHGTMLSVPERRMVKADVGSRWDLGTLGADAVVTSDSGHIAATAVTDVLSCPQQPFLESVCP